MNKIEIYNYLTEKAIPFEKLDHKPVYNMAELAEIEFPHPEAEAKNLFVRDDKKRNYYLITVKGDKHVDLKQFQQQQGTRRLSFASESDLLRYLGLTPGAVTPLGILNDEERKVDFYLDRDFLMEPALIAVHPNENNATVWLGTRDLIQIIQDHGNVVNVVEI